MVLLKRRGDSISTFSNYEETVKGGFLPQDQPFTSDDPLLVVASFPHGTYRGVPVARAAFGANDRKAVRLLCAEKESALTYVSPPLQKTEGGITFNKMIK